ncbi:hypothetical protein ABIF26_005437 [Bradyrhizobium elkanii]|uniref:Uncharacterized protein n=1 Tax=Bradyrhizobium elkanii TaxID=29448 RepID=A0A8I2C424_BRAEL|nr:hypothetical protein [Bradyrhizobium elkanii]
MLNGRVIAQGFTSVGIALMVASAFTMATAQGEPIATPATARSAPISASSLAVPANAETRIRVILPAPWEVTVSSSVAPTSAATLR